MTAENSSSAHEGVHLVVLHHGLWGNVGHVRFIAEQFKQRLGDRILVYRAQANESALTYDGVDICGQRLVQEIYSVVKVIEAGGNIEEMKGQKSKTKKSKKGTKGKETAPSITTDTPAKATTYSSDLEGQQPHHSLSLDLSGNLDEPAPGGPSRPKKVTQFSYLGYSLGGLIGRFAMGMLDLEGFFNPPSQGGRGVEPMYFVTMATPHLGIRQPPLSRWKQFFNYASARLLSRTGEQLQFVDDYIGGKPILLVMSEPTSVFIHALKRFKRRAVYCNIRNDRSVPFWTASFSDADPFMELDSMDIQYNTGYSSLIESFEYQDYEAISRRQKELAETLKAATFRERTAHRLKAIPWKRYALFGILGPILLPLWIVIICSTISLQGLSSRRRTKPIVDSDEDLQRMRDEAVITRISTLDQEDSDTEMFSSSRADSVTHLNKHEQHQDKQTETVVDFQPSQPNTHTDSSVTLAIPSELCASTTVATNRKKTISPSSSATTSMAEIIASDNADESTSFSYPHLKRIKPLGLLPVQVDISRNLNKLKWKKNIIHIEGMNAHGSIVVREKRFSNDGGIAAVQHAVDMFKDDGEDE